MNQSSDDELEQIRNDEYIKVILQYYFSLDWEDLLEQLFFLNCNTEQDEYRIVARKVKSGYFVKSSSGSQ